MQILEDKNSYVTYLKGLQDNFLRLGIYYARVHQKILLINFYIEKVCLLR